MLRFFILFFSLFLVGSQAYSQANFFAPEPVVEGLRKKRITEILRRDNYGQIEPYFYVSNRPTLDEALSDEIKNRTLVSPMNHMVYCPTGTDYFSSNRFNAGTVYISSEHLPKNGLLTDRWFYDAYQYRIASDPLSKPANVAIISPKRQNFLRVRCPKTHNNIIVSTAALNPRNLPEPQKNIDTVRSLRYASNPEISWNKKDFTLPSHMEKDYIEMEVQEKGNLGSIDINPPFKYIAIAREAASKHGVLLKFLLAIAEVASHYKPDATSKDGLQKGMMFLSNEIQSLYSNDLLIKSKDQNDMVARESFDDAAQYIKALYYKYNGDIEKILMAYFNNVNPTNDALPNIQTDGAFVFAQEVFRRFDRKQDVIFKNN